MDRLGLNHADLATYHAGLILPHERKITVQVLDMDDHVIDELDTTDPDVAASIRGQVSVDASATPTRSLDLTFLDPKGAFDFDPSSPAATGLHVSRQIRVISSRNISGLGWVRCRLFTGPIRAFNRTAEQVELTAYGREVLGMGQLWSAFARKKGVKKTDVIRALLARYGESRFDIPDLSSRLPHHMALRRRARPWPRAKHLAQSMNRQLFYPGTGVATLRNKPTQIVMTLDDYAVTRVGAQRSLDGVFNAVRVTGGRPKGAKTQVHATDVLPRWHDLSPQNLAPTGGELYLVKEINNTHVRSSREAQRLATRELHDAALELVTITVSTVPIDHLQEYDMLRAAGTRFRLRQYTIPISLDGAATTSIGFLKRTSRA